MAKRQQPVSGSNALWICPRCRRRFKNRNQWHSCGAFTVEQLLEGKPPAAVALYEALESLIMRCGAVVVSPTKTRVLFKVRTVFATVDVKTRWLDLVFVLGRSAGSRRIRKTQVEYPGIVHWLRIGRADDLDDEVADWLQEAYDYRREKDLGDSR